MWNLLSASKLTQKTIQKKDYQRHKRNLNKIKGVIEINLPEQPIFLFEKPKLEMARRDRLRQIDRENQILLSRLDQVNKKTNLSNVGPRYIASLSQRVNTLAQQRIEQDNKRICLRLVQASSHYPTGRILTESNRLEKLQLSISQNARRCSSASRLSLKRSATPSTCLARWQSCSKENLSEKQIQMARPLSAPSARKRRQIQQLQHKEDIQYQQEIDFIQEHEDPGPLQEEEFLL